jgi:poly(beta-D-mannuronate) lyase
LPGQVLDLSSWKISLPTTPDPTQIVMPELADYSDPSFRVVSAVQFTAPVGGGVQNGSKYPRSELREMNPDGTAAAWSTTQGRHSMQLVQRITHLPTVKSELVAGQIHDAHEYVVLIRLSSTELSVEYDGESIGMLDDEYVLSTVFTLRIEASGGFIDVLYNGKLKAHQADTRDGCYFKAGCYTQSNNSTGDAPGDFGRVEILELTVQHTADE